MNETLDKSKNPGFTLLEMMIIVAVLAVMAAVFAPGFTRAVGQKQLNACKSNVMNIGTACELYSTAHHGKYPSKLADLTKTSEGGYLKSIPVCPSTGTDTYSPGYTCFNNGGDFCVCCRGENHKDAEVASNFPMYDSANGLMVRDNNQEVHVATTIRSISPEGNPFDVQPEDPTSSFGF